MSPPEEGEAKQPVPLPRVSDETIERIWQDSQTQRSFVPDFLFDITSDENEGLMIIVDSLGRNSHALTTLVLQYRALEEQARIDRHPGVPSIDREHCDEVRERLRTEEGQREAARTMRSENPVISRLIQNSAETFPESAAIIRAYSTWTYEALRTTPVQTSSD